jgi:hypothetical protein
VVRVELEDVVVCVGGWVDIDCEEIFKVLPVQALFQNFFSKAELCVCVCVCVILFQKIPRRRSFVQVWTRERECD